MDVLLTHGYFLQEDLKEQQIMKPYPPLGLLYLCSYLKSRGFAPEVFDSTFRSRDELYRLLQGHPPSVLGIYGNLLTRPAVVQTIQVAKAAGWRVVLGGPEPANYVEEYLQAGADIVVMGEGERTLEDLLDWHHRGAVSDPAEIDGIAFRTCDGTVRWTKPRQLLPDLNRQPWPDRAAIDLRRYLDTWRKFHGAGAVSLITARGCPYECRWCSHAVYGRTHRRRSPQDVANEIAWLRVRYDPEMLWIADDVFTIHPGWLEQYAREIRLRDLALPFECITRADRLTPRLVDLLTDLKCFRVWIGSESGSQRILDRMHRGVKVEQVRKAVGLCKAAGIETGMFVMWGYEGEEPSDIEATVEHVRTSDPDVFLTTVAYPIKGTEYFDDVSASVVRPTSWQQSSDRDHRIRGRHSRKYYQFADQLLKSTVALSRAQSQSLGATPAGTLADLQQTIAQARAGMSATRLEVETS
ncbi:MAG: radical SAM protein [Acidobacteriota bacterium]